MKAALCKELGPPESLVLEEAPDPEPGPRQVVVDVVASAVNYPDVLMLKGQYQVRPELPFAPGGEVAGVVSAVGAEVTGWAVGDEVMAVIGSGGFAEKAVVPAGALHAVPAGMDMDTASGFLMAYGTSYHALVDRAAIRPGETLLVLGAAGGTGLTAVEIGAALGAVVVAAASSAEKLAACAERGAAFGINYSTEDLRARLKEVTGGRGPDVVYDPVGGDYAEPAFRSIAWEGRYLVIGFTGGPIPRLPLNLPLLKGAAVVGVFWGGFVARDPERSRRNVEALGEMFRSGLLGPIVTSVHPLTDAGRAIRELEDRRAVGKVVVRVRP